MSTQAGLRQTRRHAFTLIELMITVSIIGILAAIALPRYEAFLVRAKRAELPMNLDAIRSNEIGYHAEWDVYTSCELSPNEVPVCFYVSLTS